MAGACFGNSGLSATSLLSCDAGSFCVELDCLVNLGKAGLCGKFPVEGVTSQCVLVEEGQPVFLCVAVPECNLTTELVSWKNGPSPFFLHRMHFLHRM